jgi:dihydrofolate reductase
MKAIAAMSRNRVIGHQGKIPWHLPEDFKWFKRCTSGQVVLMGRKTFESLGKPLPNRTNLVVTRGAEIAGVEVVRDLAAFDPASYAPRQVWVIGGEDIYRQMLGRCSELFLSVINRDAEGDAFFPEFESRYQFVEEVLQTPDFSVRHYRRKAGEAASVR